MFFFFSLLKMLIIIATLVRAWAWQGRQREWRDLGDNVGRIRARGHQDPHGKQHTACVCVRGVGGLTG